METHARDEPTPRSKSDHRADASGDMSKGRTGTRTWRERDRGIEQRPRAVRGAKILFEREREPKKDRPCFS